MAKYLLALDQGTTSTRSVLFRLDGSIHSMSQIEFTQIYPQPGWVEHDPMEILDTQIKTMRDVLEKANATPQDVAAIGITNQRETTVLWDKKTGKPVYNAIVWQCRRTADIAERIKADEQTALYIRETTGLVPDAYFSATKIRWILDHIENGQVRAEAGDLVFGTIDTWLLWNLTKDRVHATDYTNASRTMAYDIKNLCWDERILRMLSIPKAILPGVLPSSGFFGVLDEGILGAEIPITGVAGDQHAALFGQTCFDTGDTKNTYGTGCFILMNTGEKPVSSKNGLLTTIAWGIGDKVTYALEGSVFSGGSALKWLRDCVELIKTAHEADIEAEKVPDTGGVYFVPAFTGLGAPYWDMYARGAMVGVTYNTTRRHIIRAVLESIAYQSADVFSTFIKDSGIAISRLRVDGGASKSDVLMQFQADISDVVTERPQNIETTAQGAAFLSGLHAGVYKDLDELKRIRKINRTYAPQMGTDTRNTAIAGWHTAIAAARLKR